MGKLKKDLNGEWQIDCPEEEKREFIVFDRKTGVRSRWRENKETGDWCISPLTDAELFELENSYGGPLPYLGTDPIKMTLKYSNWKAVVE